MPVGTGDARGGEREVATYAGVLAEAHEEGLKSITTRLVQIPHEDNGCNAIVEATVVTEKGSFAGIGDAAPHNVGRKIVPHIIRIAETRAKARALRDAVNIGIVSLDELGADDFEATAAAPAPAPTPGRGDRPPLREVPRPDDRRGPAPAEAHRPAPAPTPRRRPWHPDDREPAPLALPVPDGGSALQGERRPRRALPRGRIARESTA